MQRGSEKISIKMLFTFLSVILCLMKILFDRLLCVIYIYIYLQLNIIWINKKYCIKSCLQFLNTGISIGFQFSVCARETMKTF